MNNNYNKVSKLINQYYTIYGYVRFRNFRPTIQDTIKQYYTSSTVSVKIEPSKFKEGKL